MNVLVSVLDDCYPIFGIFKQAEDTFLALKALKRIQNKAGFLKRWTELLTEWMTAVANLKASRRKFFFVAGVTDWRIISGIKTEILDSEMEQSLEKQLKKTAAHCNLEAWIGFIPVAAFGRKHLMKRKVVRVIARIPISAPSRERELVLHETKNVPYLRMFSASHTLDLLRAFTM
jgi:hypothetical protein